MDIHAFKPIPAPYPKVDHLTDLTHEECAQINQLGDENEPVMKSISLPALEVYYDAALDTDEDNPFSGLYLAAPKAKDEGLDDLDEWSEDDLFIEACASESSNEEITEENRALKSTPAAQTSIEQGGNEEKEINALKTPSNELQSAPEEQTPSEEGQEMSLDALRNEIIAIGEGFMEKLRQNKTIQATDQARALELMTECLARFERIKKGDTPPSKAAWTTLSMRAKLIFDRTTRDQVSQFISQWVAF